VSQIEKVLANLAGDRDLLNRLRQQGMSYARERLTWDAKAQSTTRVLNWAVGRDPKPDFPSPKMLHLERDQLVLRRAAHHAGANVDHGTT